MWKMRKEGTHGKKMPRSKRYQSKPYTMHKKVNYGQINYIEEQEDSTMGAEDNPPEYVFFLEDRKNKRKMKSYERVKRKT